MHKKKRESRATSRDEKSASRVYIRTFGCQMDAVLYDYCMFLNNIW